MKWTRHGQVPEATRHPTHSSFRKPPLTAPLFFLPTKPIGLVLKQDLTWAIRRGFPWLYAQALRELPPAPSGSLALVRDRHGEILAKGIYDPASHLSVRILDTSRQSFSQETVAQRLQRAKELRARSTPSQTNCYRLLNGEGDFLPGLVCDIYHTTAVLKFDGSGPEGFWNAPAFASWLAAHLSVTQVYLRHRDSPEKDCTLFGDAATKHIEVLEHGRLFEVNFAIGQKTGFFLDQRENRHTISLFAKGQRVLNLFGYTGGFSIYAGTSGAVHVTTVDIAAPAIENAKLNWVRNNLAPERHDAIVADAFDYLAHVAKREERWDIVIVDPPSFTKSEEHVTNALGAYEELLVQATKVVAPNGILAAASCSRRVSFNDFYQILEKSVSRARRQARVLHIAGQPADHPFPLACEDLRYLKFFLLEIA